MSTNKKIVTGKFVISPILLLSIILLSATNTANAQLDTFDAMYYQNQYLANPAMAGLNKGININLGYQRQWENVPGNPVLMYATAEYNPNSRMAYGVNFNSDRAGLITNNRILGSFAYHLPIDSEDRKINFGLSIGARFLSLDNSKISGDITDPYIQNFNEGGAIDGDFGISYTSKFLTLQVAVPNLNNVFFQNDDGERKYVDSQVFYSAVSYKFYLTSKIDDFSIEPLIAFRGIRGYKNIVDTGIKFDMPQYHINLSAMYHTNQTISGMFGLSLERFGIFFAYSNFIGNSGAYANDVMEFGLSYKILE